MVIYFYYFSNTIKGAHTHKSRKLGVTLEARDAIVKLLETDPRMKPGCILHCLEQTNVKIPLLADLNNFLANLRKKQAKRSAKLGEMADWCLDHCDVPDHLDEPFVLDYNIFFPDDSQEDRVFRFFLTTKKLLTFSAKAQRTDATHSVNWNGFPLIIPGTLDLNRKFFPLGLVLCSEEAQFDPKFLFNCLALGRNQCGEEALEKSSLMADAAIAINNGFTEFNESVIVCLIRAMCWFYVKNVNIKMVTGLNR